MNRTIALLFAIGLVVPSLAMGADGEDVRVAFFRVRFDERGILHGTLFVKTVGGTERQITPNTLNVGNAVWTPDGTKIVVTEHLVDDDGALFNKVYVADLSAETVAFTGLWAGASDASNEHVTFTFIKNMTSWVGIARFDATERVDLAPDAIKSTLSSDGSRMVFHGGDGVDIINRDATGQRTLIRDPLIDASVRPRFAGDDRYVVYQAFRGTHNHEKHLFSHNIETGETTDLGPEAELRDVVGDWLVVGGGKRKFAVSLDGETRFDLPLGDLPGVVYHGDLSTLAPSTGGGGDDEPRAVSAWGKLPTTWAEIKTR